MVVGEAQNHRSIYTNVDRIVTIFHDSQTTNDVVFRANEVATIADNRDATQSVFLKNKCEQGFPKIYIKCSLKVLAFLVLATIFLVWRNKMTNMVRMRVRLIIVKAIHKWLPKRIVD